MKDFNTQLEDLRIKLHKEIEERAKNRFFMVEFWHIYRTTGIIIYKK